MSKKVQKFNTYFLNAPLQDVIFDSSLQFQKFCTIYTFHNSQLQVSKESRIRIQSLEQNIVHEQ